MRNKMYSRNIRITILMMLIIWLASLVIPFTALAADLTVTAPDDILDAELEVGPNGALDLPVTVISSVDYDIEINADTAPNKTVPNMKPWQEGVGYLDQEALEYTLGVRRYREEEPGYDWQAVTTTPTAIEHCTGLPPTAPEGDVIGIDLLQMVFYGDARLTDGSVYRVELTYTVTAHI